MTSTTNGVTATIDLRKLCQAVRDQGTRATCLACTTSDAHAMHHSCDPLSAEFLFYYAIQRATIGTVDDGITFDGAAEALAHDGQPLEVDWPYSAAQPTPWQPPAAKLIWKGTLSHSASNAVPTIESLLKQGRPVVLGVKLSSAFLSPTIPDFKISATGSGFGGHAVLIVGLGRDQAAEDYFLIRNSWGSGWANNGCAWLATGYLADKLIGFASVS